MRKGAREHELADFAVGCWLQGLSLAEQIRNFATLPGVIYAILLLLFAAMPLLANRKSWRGAA
jgi:hypothetical protein